MKAGINMTEKKCIEKSRQLISVCIELSDKCKVGCPYCLLEEKKDEESFSQMLDIIDVLNSYGVLRYTIGGGEPLDVPYVYEIGEYIRKLHHKVLLRTSACNYINFEKIKNSFDLVDISIDSYRKETMKICKPYIDSDIVFDNIKNFYENNIDCRCNILVTKYNYNDVISTITWLADNGVNNIRIQRLVPRGKAKKIFKDINVSNEDYSNLIEDVFLECDKLNIHINEVKSVNSQTLCIVKPNGNLYIGTQKGIIRIGEVFDINALDRASELVYDNQKKVYGVDEYAGIESD